MLTIDLDHKLEASLLEIAKQEHTSPTQVINDLLAQYLSSRQSADLLVNIAKDLPKVALFADRDPLVIQKEMRDEWH